MTRTRGISPHEWIQDYLSPVVGVMSSPEVESLCRRNNLTLVELLQPFSKLTSEVTLKDPEGITHSISGLNIIFQDHRRDPARSFLNGKLIPDAVNHINEESLIQRTLGGFVLEAPRFTPWFDIWMKMTLASVPIVEHEFLRNHVGCVFAVGSGDPNVVETLKTMTQRQHKHQHERSGHSSATYPQYLTVNILKFYLFVHDVYRVPEAKAHEQFTKVQNAFGSANCHLLQINSKPDLLPVEEADAGNSSVGDIWTDHLASGHRFCDVEARLAAIVGQVDSSTSKSAGNNVQNNSEVNLSQTQLDHPLALAVDGQSPDVKNGLPPTSEYGVSLTPVTAANVALRLDSKDIERLRLFVKNFAIKGLIPHVEKQLRILQEIVTNRKGRSLFNVGVKRWFGQNKPGAASGTSVVYGRDAIELQLRKLGDLYFMFNLYKQAHSCFHTAKRDFQSDEAWNYYAGATEMTALSQFMQIDVPKKYPAHYMEDSITKYLSVCQMPEFAVRATLFHALCLKSQGMFQDAAAAYIRVTNEAKDLRSGLLLEQAAYCFLLCPQPLVRKYAFHIILAGYRFAKGGQKRHASRTYNQGFQVYRGHQWTLSEDHILYSLGHQSLLLKDHKNAATLFNELLSMPLPNPNPLQQMCHLREFFIVHHLKEKEDRRTATITIPTFIPQDSVVDLGGGDGGSDRTSLNDDTFSALDRHWQSLEKVIVEKVTGQDMMLMSKTSQTTFSSKTNNSLKPQATVGEPVKVYLPAKNIFQTPLLLRNVHLVWNFAAANDDDDSGVQASNGENRSANCHEFVESHVLTSVLLESGAATSVMELGFTPLRPGRIDVVGVEYDVKAQFPDSESTDYTIRGRQPLSVSGPRLTTTKEHKTNVVYGKDNRFEFSVVNRRPRLTVDVANLPDVLLRGEIRKLDLTLKNNTLCCSGSKGTAVERVFLVHTCPGMFSFGRTRRRRDCNRSLPFRFPVVTDQSLMLTDENDARIATSLDILPLDLPDDAIRPGKELKVPLWMHGCASDRRPEVYVYYEYKNEVKTERHRIFKLFLATQIAPSITVSATKIPTCVFANDPSYSVLVNVSNGVLEAANKFRDRQLDRIRVSQIALLSGHGHRLTSVVSRSGANVQPISPSESANFCLESSGADVDFGDEKLCISDVRWGGGGGSDCSGLGPETLPYLDFLKPGFDFTNLTRVRGPNLKQDLIVVSWEGRLVGQTDAIQGQTFVPLVAANCEDATGADVLDSSSNVRKSRTKTANKAESPPSKKRCCVSATVDNRIVHDFRASPVAMVPLEVAVVNPNSRSDAVFFYKVNDTLSNCRVVGCTQARLCLAAGEKRLLQLHVCLTSTGIYNFTLLKFQTLDEGKEELDENRLTPLQVALLVDQA